MERKKERKKTVILNRGDDEGVSESKMIEMALCVSVIV